MARADGISQQSASLRLQSCPAPRNFRPAGAVDWAHPDEHPPPFLLRPRRYRGRRALGIRYERKVHDYLNGACGGVERSYFPSEWFKFASGESVRWCQPDGLILHLREGIVTVVEVKYQHTPDAWFQLRELYEPVLRVAMPGWRFALLEVVKWYDPSTFFPERVVLCADPLQAPLGAVGVHIWNP